MDLDNSSQEPDVSLNDILKAVKEQGDINSRLRQDLSQLRLEHARPRKTTTPPILHVLKHPGEINFILIHSIQTDKITSLLLQNFPQAT
jgi:hypothetical protein